MDYYKIQSIMNTRTNEPDTEKEQEYAARYFADFEELIGSVCWCVITPLYEMRRGHLTKVLEITEYRVSGQLVMDGENLKVVSEKYIFLFERIENNPLDVTLRK